MRSEFVIPAKAGIQRLYDMSAYVYILTNKRYGTLYVGVTNDLIRRIHEHKQKIHKSFSQKYETTKLVYFESGESIEGAITREKQLKNWKRSWKIELIEKMNPSWRDLFLDYAKSDGSRLSPG